MKCKHCNGENVRVHCNRKLSSGYAIRYMCKDCNRTFVDREKQCGVPPKTKMDDTDFKIFDCLKKNVRASYISIAKKIGISDTAVYRRVNNLVELGFIKFSVDLITDNISPNTSEKVENTPSEFDNIAEGFGLVKVN